MSAQSFRRRSPVSNIGPLSVGSRLVSRSNDQREPPAHSFGGGVERPVTPADLRTLAIGIVVASLRTREFVAGEQHRRSFRQQQGGAHVSHLPPAQCQGRPVVGRPFDAAVPRAVVRMAVAIVFAARALRIGSRRTAFLRKPLSMSNPLGSRARTVPRANRNPSTCIPLTQYRELSMANCITRACERFNVLPVPVSLM